MECRNCVYWHPEWTADPSQFSYCEYWHIDTKGTEKCDNFDTE